MSGYNFRLQRILTPVSSLVGVLAVGGGVYSLVDPISFADTLGIPITSPSSPALPFVSFAGARNFGSGITMLALLYTGQRKAVGTLLMCGVAVAMMDAWICFKYWS
jgi:hypothetical protein